MGKRLHHVTQREQKRGRTPGGTSISHARSLKITSQHMVQLNQLEVIWESFPYGLIACDRNQRIVRINAAACKLLEVVSEAQCQGRDYQHFLTRYLRSGEQSLCFSSEQWLMNLALAGTTGGDLPKQTLLLHLPSGREIPVSVRSFPAGDQERNVEETVFVIQEFTHARQEVSRLQQAHEAMLDLINAIAQIPEQRDHLLPEDTFLLAPPVLFVAQQLADVVRSVLACQRVDLLAFGHRTDHLYFVAGSGLTAEQEQHWREVGGRFQLLDLVDDAACARLGAHQDVIIDHFDTIEYLGKHLPFPAYSHLAAPDSEIFLLLPLFLEQRWVGVLIIAKASSEGKYTLEEIELMKAVTAQTMLVVEGIHCFYAQEEKQKRALIQREVSRLISEFLNLATHELRTPLTVTMGNLQLAQRRLRILRDQLASSPAQLRNSVASVQQPLAAAEQGARLQQRMVDALIDDARIQTNTLLLSSRSEDLLALLREVVTRQQQAEPEHTIVLDIPSLEQKVPIIADAGRIKQVLHTYLSNALTFSPPGRPVVVRLKIADKRARVSVHNEGAGIAREDLAHIWGRFYRTKGAGVQHDLDLSFGLALYLCREFIERQQGSVGVQSAPGQGATFWFTLPITPAQKG